MNFGKTGPIDDLVRERQRTMAMLPSIDQRLAAIGARQDDLILEIGDAEERGDWPLASRLRNQRLSQRPSRDVPSH